jgi:hypothetical protein
MLGFLGVARPWSLFGTEETVELFVEGYTGRVSYSPGEELSLHFSTSATTVAVEIVRLGLKPETVWSAKNIPGRQQSVPIDASSQGCKWPVSTKIPLPKTSPTHFEVTIDPETDFAKQIFVGENLCAAMTFIYHGHVDTGLEIARRIYAAVAITSRSPWNQWCLINAETGLPVWGEDYYSNMVMWAVPMALGNQGVGEFVQGEFVQALLHPVS